MTYERAFFGGAASRTVRSHTTAFCASDRSIAGRLRASDAGIADLLGPDQLRERRKEAVLLIGPRLRADAVSSATT